MRRVPLHCVVRVLGRGTACCLSLGLLVAGTGALAGPPYNVDDPGTQNFRDLVAYISSYTSQSRQRFTSIFPNLAFAYGLRRNLELDAGLSGYTSNVPAPIPFPHIADPAFAAKWRFAEEGKTRPALAVSYQFTLDTEDHGLGTGFVSHALGLTLSKTRRRAAYWANVGVNVYPRPGWNSSAYWGIAGDYGLNGRLRVGVQLYGNAADAGYGISEEAAWGVGATYVATSRVTLLFQGGHSMKGNNDFNLYAGAVVRLSR